MGTEPGQSRGTLIALHLPSTEKLDALDAACERPPGTEFTRSAMMITPGSQSIPACLRVFHRWLAHEWQFIGGMGETPLLPKSSCGSSSRNCGMPVDVACQAVRAAMAAAVHADPPTLLLYSEQIVESGKFSRGLPRCQATATVLQKPPA